MLNWIWAGFFFVAFLAGLFRWLVLGESGVWAAMVGSSFEMAKTGFEISIGLTGVMCLWLGIMKIGEKGGAVALVARAFDPLLRRLFPSVPPAHPAGASIVMNLSANVLGLDNAATPLGLKAMKELQDLNPTPDTASNDQIMFLVINASAVTIIPRDHDLPPEGLCRGPDGSSCRSSSPRKERRRPLAPGSRAVALNPVVLTRRGGLSSAYRRYCATDGTLERRRPSPQPPDLLLIVVLAAWRRVPVYETFVEGAKEGFEVAVSIIPYLVAMLVAIGVLRASGALDIALNAVRWVVVSLGADARWVDALPVGLMRPLSGSGSRGLVIETMKTFGADSSRADWPASSRAAPKRRSTS
jgi:spore maturation protein SpmA